MRDPGVETGKGRMKMAPMLGPEATKKKRKEWAAGAKVNDEARADSFGGRENPRKEAAKRSLGMMKRANPFA